LGPGGLAVADEAVQRSQVRALHLPIEPVLPGGPGFAAPEMVNDGYQGIGNPAAQPTIEKEQRRMRQLILEQQLKVSPAQTFTEVRRKVVQQTAAVGAPGDGDDFHLVPPAHKMLDQLPIIEEAAGDQVKSAIKQQPQMQLAFLPVGGPGDVILPNLGGEGVERLLEAAAELLAEDSGEMLDAGIEPDEFRQLVQGLLPIIGHQFVQMG